MDLGSFDGPSLRQECGRGTRRVVSRRRGVKVVTRDAWRGVRDASQAARDTARGVTRHTI